MLSVTTEVINNMTNVACYEHLFCILIAQSDLREIIDMHMINGMIEKESHQFTFSAEMQEKESKSSLLKGEHSICWKVVSYPNEVSMNLILFILFGKSS